METADNWLKIISEHPGCLYEGISIPNLPSDEIQITTTSQCGFPTLREGHLFYTECMRLINIHNPNINYESKLLDFGVGWGRICRFFLKDFKPENIYGIDVSDKYIGICKDTFKLNDNFIKVDPFPPANLLSDSFDVVVGFSVFSHLSESACRKWMEEFNRVCKKDAILILTTRNRNFLEECIFYKEELKNNKIDNKHLLYNYFNFLSEMFEDINSVKENYDNGKFIHVNLVKDDITNEYYYGETLIPKKYAESSYSDMFDLLDFIYNPGVCNQSIMVFKKR